VLFGIGTVVRGSGALGTVELPVLFANSDLLDTLRVECLPFPHL
jgi:hypothetical protein